MATIAVPPPEGSWSMFLPNLCQDSTEGHGSDGCEEERIGWVVCYGVDDTAERIIQTILTFRRQNITERKNISHRDCSVNLGLCIILPPLQSWGENPPGLQREEEEEEGEEEVEEDPAQPHLNTGQD